MIVDYLNEDTTLITVNRRLARTVTEAFAVDRAAAGDLTWRSPDVIPFSAWTDRCFRSAAAHVPGADLVPLRAAQEHMVWEQLVRQNAPPDEDVGALLAAAARRAQDAHALINAWNISLDGQEFGFSSESRAFQSWARAFRAYCSGGGWIDASSVATAVSETIWLAAANPRPRAVFAGFDFKTPQQHAIRSALERLGVEVIDAPPPQREARQSFYVYDDASAELRAAALWARNLLEYSHASRIGIVVPELHRVRAEAERIFDELLNPGCAMPGRAEEDRAFNISYGEPISRISVTGDALIALKLAGLPVELVEVGRMLRSPYLRGGHSAFAARARFDARLRDIGEPELILDRLAARAGGERTLELDLEALVALRRKAPRRQPLRLWSAFFSLWLSAIGWPGERNLESSEFQAVEAFRGLLDELAGMDAVSAPVALDRALSLLIKLADESLFQPRSESAPVQILGSLETAGLDFDGLWITGLHDGSWPPAPEPDPFVPVSLQRAAGVPTASPDGQLRLAGSRMKSWRRAANDVVMSYPRYDQDEPLRPSPLLGTAHFDLAAGDGSEPVEYTRMLNREPALLELIADDRAPESRPAPGGAGVLRDQAACPFRAFARWRLGADAVPVAVSPMDARIRGNLVHSVLSALWCELGSQTKLNALTAAELRTRISVAVEAAIGQERQHRPDTLRGTFANTEHARLCSLMEAWFAIEMSRAPFEVAARETKIDAAIGPLTLSIRPDRIDRLQSGEHFVIDYKTGIAELRHWFGERPDDPQLALYTLAVEAEFAGRPVAGAAYGGVRRGALGYRGLADRDGVAEGVSTVAVSPVRAAKTVADWPALKSQWRQILETLAREFASGDARVDPKSGPATCAGCRVMPLCRIFEQRRESDDEGKA